jgi:hypothetical protein
MTKKRKEWSQTAAAGYWTNAREPALTATQCRTLRNTRRACIVVSARSKGTDTAALTACSEKHFATQVAVCGSSFGLRRAEAHDAEAPMRFTHRKTLDRLVPQQLCLFVLSSASWRADNSVALLELDPVVATCTMLAESARLAP